MSSTLRLDLSGEQIPFRSWWRHRKFGEKALLIIFGALGLSPLGWEYLFNIGGNLVIEPGFALMAAGVFAVNKKAASHIVETISQPMCALSLFALIGLMFLGVLTTGDIVASYADFRSSSLLVISFFLVSSRSENIRNNSIICCVVICVSSILSHVVYYRLFWVEQETVKNIYPFSAILFVAAVLTRCNKEWPWFALLGVSLLICVTAFFRQYYFYTGLIAFSFLIFIYGQLTSKQNSGSSFVTVICAIAALSLLAPSLLNNIYDYMSANESRSIQSIEKFNNILSFSQGGDLGGGDDLRAAYFDYIGAHLLSFMLPSGLGSRALIGSWGPFWASDKLEVQGANSIDGGHLYIAAHLGLFLGAALIALLLVRVLTAALREPRSKDMIYHLMFIVAACSFFAFTGSMFTVLSFAFSFGSFIGLLVRPWGRQLRISVAVQDRRVIPGSTTNIKGRHVS